MAARLARRPSRALEAVVLNVGITTKWLSGRAVRPFATSDTKPNYPVRMHEFEKPDRRLIMEKPSNRNIRSFRFAQQTVWHNTNTSKWPKRTLNRVMYCAYRN